MRREKNNEIIRAEQPLLNKTKFFAYTENGLITNRIHSVLKSTGNTVSGGIDAPEKNTDRNYCILSALTLLSTPPFMVYPEKYMTSPCIMFMESVRHPIPS